MNVAQISTWRVRCGIAGYAEHLRAALVAEGAACDVVPIDRDHADYLSRKELERYFDELAEQALDADLVHIQHDFGLFAGAYGYGTSLRIFRRVLRRFRAARVPVVVTFHTDPYWFELWTGEVAGQARQLGAKALWRAHVPRQFGAGHLARAIAHSRDTRRRMIDAGIPPAAIQVVRQGVAQSPAMVEASPARHAQARAWLGFPPGARVAVVFGFVVDYKGHVTAVKALRSLPDDFHVLVLGGPHERGRDHAFDDLLAAVEEDDEITPRVRYTGWLSERETDECLLAADMCVFPYRDFPRFSSSAALGRALAADIPVLASRIPAFVEFEQRFGCLELVAPDAPRELALAMEMLSHDEPRREALRDAGRRFCATHTWTAAAREHLGVYEQAIAAASRRRPGRGARPVSRRAAPGPRPETAARVKSGPAPAAIATNGSAAQGSISANGGPPLVQGDPPLPIRIRTGAEFESIATPDGYEFWLPVVEDDLVFALAHKGRLMREALWQLLRLLAPPGSTVLDLGAHIGSVALPLAAAGCRVIAVEASPRNVALLRAATVRNRFEQIDVVHAAVGDEMGTIRFVEDGASGFVTADGKAFTSKGRPADTIEVRSVTVDQLMEARDWPEVDLIKLDVEGSEPAVLAGMQRLLGRGSLPVIVLEVNVEALRRVDSSPERLLAQVEQLGYRLLLIDQEEHGRLVPIDSNAPPPRLVADYLALPPGMEIPPPWREEAYEPIDIAGRLVIDAKSKDDSVREHVATTISSIPAEARHRSLEQVLDRLVVDPMVAVGATARTSGAPAGRRRPIVPRPFWNEGRPTFALATSLDGLGGYGYSAEELTRAATAQGADIGWIITNTISEVSVAPAIWAMELPRARAQEYETLLIYLPPYAWSSLRAPTTLSFTMWETTELPDSWVAPLHTTKGLIVPSEFNREVFSQKVKIPIEVVPLGVNPRVFPLLERPEREVFTFLMVGGLSIRKGPDIAIRAFEEEFRPHEPVQLVLKSYRDTLDWNGHQPTDKRIRAIFDAYDRPSMIDLYRTADCIVACSRGEAAGLVPREAMSTGIPAIVTDWGGMRELCDPQYSFPLEIDGEEPAFGGSFSIGVTGGSKIGSFATPSVEHLRELMRQAYTDRKATREMGLRAAAWIHAEWNYDRCAAKWLEAVARLADGAPRPDPVARQQS